MPEESEDDKNSQMDIRILYALGFQWIKIDDVIAWSKKHDLHEVTKEFVKLKNQKPRES